jgi:hypothetical protein
MLKIMFISVEWLISILGIAALCLLTMPIASCITHSKGLEYCNPLWLHSHYKLNCFGAWFVAIVLNILSWPATFWYWIYKLCTIGRR